MKSSLLPLAGLMLGLTTQAFATPLTLVNQTESGILNILAQTPKKEFFFRVDLMPGSREDVENPGGKATLRADTGLQFWTFPQIDLAASKKLTFCKEHSICLVVEGKTETKHIAGTSQQLVPTKDDNPVCNLDNFHPTMTMGQVCAILPGEMPHDDNGALLTGIGFGGLTWAARLIPVQSGAITDKTQLEHLELRRPIDKNDLARLLGVLTERGYAPWQAEFPGIDMEFDPNADPNRKKEVLLANLAGFLAAHVDKGHKNHALKEKCDEASIIFAPSKLLPALENADAPPQDLEIYTLILRPCTNTLLLDVAAYRGEK